MARLMILRSPDPALAGRVVDLTGFEVTLGREAVNDLAIADPALSRRHARILPSGDGWLLEDLESGNGTRVNGERIRRHTLRRGDRLLLGTTEIVFEDEEATTLMPLPSPGPAGEATLLQPLPPPVPPGPPRHQIATSPPPPPPAGPVACPVCGRALRPGARFCGGCGTALSVQPEPPAVPPPIAPPSSVPPRRASLWIALAAAALIAFVAGAAFLLLRGPSSAPASKPAKAADGEAPAPTLIPDPDFPLPPPLKVEREKKLASTKITARAGGSLSSGDGLTLTVPAGALDQNRTVAIHSARVPGPPLSAGVVGQAAAPMEVLKTWDVDLGPETGLMPGEMELAIDVSAYPPERYPLLCPAIAADGCTWTRLPAERKGDTLVFSTRHCSPVCLLGLAQATAVVLPIAAITYLVYDRVDEFPSRYNAHAPFLSVDDNPEGFEIYWSKRVPGADPKTGFKDEKGYLAELEKIAKAYQNLQASGPSMAASVKTEIREMKRDYLMPDCVRRMETALAMARDYLKTRGIQKPLLNLPVYIVPSLGEKSGYIHNPWSGRRYMLISADLGAGTMNTTALHELLHHYQTGYVWLDRKGHLPLMEASALLMEREAEPYYKNLKKPYNTSEGVALAQFVAYRHGLDGPEKWEEQFVRKFGYGLTWFLEYLRDEHWVGVLKKNKPEDFHAELLKYWGANKYNAIHKALAWAAGGNEHYLAKALDDFARNWVLKCPVDRCGGRSPYGALYNGCPLADSPYADLSVDYGVGNATVDMAATPLHTVDDSFIRPWSIQFLRLKGPSGGKAVAAVEIPREWFPNKGRKRSVYVREGPDKIEIEEFDDEAPEGSPSAWGSIALQKEAYLYVVDTGQTGSGWVYNYQPARIILLEPPGGIEGKVENGRLRLKWRPPSVASSLKKEIVYFAYVEGDRAGPLKVSDGTSQLEALISPDDLPRWSGAEAPALAMTSAVKIGIGDDGEAKYIESPRSDIVGGGNAGNYTMELAIDAAIETHTTRSSCNRMTSHWQFQGFQHAFPVQVGPDGTFAFQDQWTGRDKRWRFTAQGRGTFRGKAVKIEGSFTAKASFTMNEKDVNISNRGTFTGEGKYTMDIWFGDKVRGEFQASSSEHYCARWTNNECMEWKTDQAECSGTLAPLVSSINAFTRRP